MHRKAQSQWLHSRQKENHQVCSHQETEEEERHHGLQPGVPASRDDGKGGMSCTVISVSLKSTYLSFLKTVQPQVSLKCCFVLRVFSDSH